MLSVVKPDSSALQEAYFHFRWLHLREPWNFPPGSERDEYEKVSEHRVIINDQRQIVACGRVHFNSAEEAQIRHIAVRPDYRAKGVGKQIMHELEKVALEQGAVRAVTNSRETSIAFFQACGFGIQREATNELGMLKRQQMVKTLKSENYQLSHPKWCEELQKTWEETIPISHHMGIKLSRYTGYQLEVIASLNRNVNLHGSMFAGSVFSHATLTGWGLIFLQLKKNQLDGDIVLGDGNIHYHKPVTMKPIAICELASLKGDLQDLRNNKKCRIDLTVNVLDDQQPVAEFVGTYWILPKKGA